MSVLGPILVLFLLMVFTCLAFIALLCFTIVFVIVCVSLLCFNIGIKHGFSCINIRQVPWEVLITEAEDLTNVNALKTMFDRYLH